MKQLCTHNILYTYLVYFSDWAVCGTSTSTNSEWQDLPKYSQWILGHQSCG